MTDSEKVLVANKIADFVEHNINNVIDDLSRGSLRYDVDYLTCRGEKRNRYVIITKEVADYCGDIDEAVLDNIEGQEQCVCGLRSVLYITDEEDTDIDEVIECIKSMIKYKPDYQGLNENELDGIVEMLVCDYYDELNDEVDEEKGDFNQRVIEIITKID